MDSEHMRGRRLLSLFAALVLGVALAAPGLAAAGNAFTFQLGSTFTVKGRTGSPPGQHARAIGRVVVSGRWGSARWHVLTTTLTDQAGNYRFTLKPHRRGQLTVRVATPDLRPRHYLLHVT
jgi:hypothetical protein